jgi:hypothetical protein
MDNDTQDPSNLETLPCAECGQLVATTDDTRIGISRLDGAPAPLCSPTCAADNARRLLEALRCRCGAEVDIDQELLTRRGEVLGCEACRWSGTLPKGGCVGCGHLAGGVVGCFCSVAGCDCPASATDLHYLSSVGGALCGTTSRRTGRAVTTTPDRGAVGCLVCVGLLELAPVLVGAGFAS